MLTEPLRARILLVLEGVELSVSELCAVFQLPQSTMSRHLKALGVEGWIGARSEGTSRLYRMLTARLPEEAHELWQLVRAEVVELPEVEGDRARVRSVLQERNARGQAFFSGAAEEWDRLRRDLVGRRGDLLGLLGFLPPEWVVGDLGCGAGQVSEALAPFVARIVGVDASPEMLESARLRLDRFDNVELRAGSLEALPLPDFFLDAAILFLVLHHVADPPEAIREVARVLRPGGTMLIVDLTRHDREEYRQAMGHTWLGFEADRLGEWCAEAGFEEFRYTALPPDPDARGPALFSAAARTARERPWVPGTID